jgi:hypothetical protein
VGRAGAEITSRNTLTFIFMKARGFVIRIALANSGCTAGLPRKVVEAWALFSS